MADSFWQDRAAADPVGRTAEQLQAQWAARTPIVPPTPSAGIGYAADEEAPPDVVTVVPSGVLRQARALDAATLDEKRGGVMTLTAPVDPVALLPRAPPGRA